MPEASGEKVELHFEDGLAIARRIYSGEMTPTLTKNPGMVP